MIFSLSKSRICESIYASAAMYAVICTDVTRPPVLHADHSAMLLRAVDEAFTYLTAALLPWVDSIDTDDADLMQLTLTLDTTDARALSIRRLMEEAIVARVLSRAYLNYSADIAASNADASDAALRRLRSALDGPRAARLVPAW